MTKPLLLIDVDGPLSPPSPGSRGRTSPALTEWAAKLADMEETWSDG